MIGGWTGTILRVNLSKGSIKKYLSLSMELVEFSESGTYKHNNVHAKFKKPPS
jgi:5-carboxymethyl-2-hydroxymuconate isomerase